MRGPDARFEPVDWLARVTSVLRDPTQLRLVFQPIVSLQHAAVVGYEALSRFPDTDVTPDQWFAAADRHGLGAELEALVLLRCLELRLEVPRGCFLTVNVSPHLLGHPALLGPLLAAGDLTSLVIEFTEHQEIAYLQPLVTLRDRLAGSGALVALDDAGSGYSGLQQMTRLRPHLVKLDRTLVADADRDEIKLALAELLGEFAGRMDAWLLAEGVETWGELEAFVRLRVPLAQGYLLGRPGPPWVQLDPATAERIRLGAARSTLVEHVASLVESVPHEAVAPIAGDQVGLRVAADGRALAVLVPLRRESDDATGTLGASGPAGHRVAPVSLRVPASASVQEVARRVVARPEHCRFDPVVCVDEGGRAVGVVRVERILLRLAELKVERPGADATGTTAVSTAGVPTMGAPR